MTTETNQIEPWRKDLNRFAGDVEIHKHDYDDWKSNHESSNGVVLYAHGDYFCAYHDDAGVLWEIADDDLPMCHCNLELDPPHRTVIHEMHIAAWIQRLCEMCMPVEFIGFEFLQPENGDLPF